MYCKNCGAKISHFNMQCPNCGKRIPIIPKVKDGIQLIINIVRCVVGVFFFISSLIVSFCDSIVVNIFFSLFFFSILPIYRVICNKLNWKYREWYAFVFPLICFLGFLISFLVLM